jgi:hypothetical protein
LSPSEGSRLRRVRLTCGDFPHRPVRTNLTRCLGHLPRYGGDRARNDSWAQSPAVVHVGGKIEVVEREEELYEIAGLDLETAEARAIGNSADEIVEYPDDPVPAAEATGSGT